MCEPGAGGDPGRAAEPGRATVLPTPHGDVVVRSPPGTFSPSPASRVMVRAIGEARGLLEGTGIDWGCGTGALAVTAARLPGVVLVFGLDRSPADVAAARENARRNGVAERTRFAVADGYQPQDPAVRERLEGLRGRLDFVTANPPASRGDDGFAHRYPVTEGAMTRLRTGGVLLLQALSAYGPERFRRLAAAVPEATYEGVFVSGDPVPLDMDRPRIEAQLRDYAAEEARGGLAYHLEDAAGRPRTATAALEGYRRDGTVPFGRWQAHLFRRT